MQWQILWRVLLPGTLCMGKAPYNHLCLEGHLGQLGGRKAFCVSSSGLILQVQPVTNISKRSWGKKSWQNWHCLNKCKCWAAVVAAATGSTASARAHHSQFLLDLLRHLCDQGTKILPNVKVLWCFTFQHANLVSRKSYSNDIEMV